MVSRLNDASMDRTGYLRSLINVAGVGIEIGPSYNPLLPKSAGFHVKTVDYIDADGLRAKYKDDPNVSIGGIETVDYIIKDRGLAETVGTSFSLDYIVASHVIEHTPDMLGFLKDCERLLKREGVLLLAVPDKRHCFDVFQPLTSTGAVLQAHFDGRRRPSLGAIFDDRAYNAVRGGAIGWSIEANKGLSFVLDLPTALRYFAVDRQSTEYTDVHVWRFVPSSFRLIANDLFEAGAIRLRECHFHDSVGNEFYMALSCEARGCTVDRLTLAKRAVAEQSQIRV